MLVKECILWFKKKKKKKDISSVFRQSLPHSCCVTLGKFLNYSELVFTYIKWNAIYFAIIK